MKDLAEGGVIQNRKADVWISLDKIFEFWETKEWTETKNTSFQNLLDTWKTTFIARWGDHNITHYMLRYDIQFCNKISIIKKSNLV